MADDKLELIPRIQTRDERHVTRGDPASGIGNLRVQVRLDIPAFAIEVHGKELAQGIAARIAERLRELYAEGRDARGVPLPALHPNTVARRRRRMSGFGMASFVSSFERILKIGGDRAVDRFKVRGGPNRSKTYRPDDDHTPLRESGLFADNVSVQFKGIESGDPIWIIAWPSGGKDRGLTTDDGKGARLFAVEHYGADRLGDIPPDLDAEIESIMEDHLAAVITAGGGILNMGRQLAAMAERVGGAIEEAAEGDTDE